jgi:hypothetical protein
MCIAEPDVEAVEAVAQQASRRMMTARHCSCLHFGLTRIVKRIYYLVQASQLEKCQRI